jgi:predicted nucleotidyltransferase
MKELVRKIQDLDTSKRVQFIVLFESQAQQTANALSEIDIAIYYNADKKQRFAFQKLVAGALPTKVDVKIFQDLPTLVKNEVLKGNILYYQDYEFLIEQFVGVIKEYRYFEKYFEMYWDELRAEVEA